MSKEHLRVSLRKWEGNLGAGYNGQKAYSNLNSRVFANICGQLLIIYYRKEYLVPKVVKASFFQLELQQHQTQGLI